MIGSWQKNEVKMNMKGGVYWFSKYFLSDSEKKKMKFCHLTLKGDFEAMK